MSETEKSKPKESPSTSTTATTTTTAAVSSSSSAVTAASKVSSSNGSATIKSSSSSSTAVASSSVSSSTGSSSSTTTTTKHQSKPPPPLPPPTPPALKHLPPPAHVGRPRANYSTPSAIRKAFLNFMKDPECLDKAANYLYESLLEDAVMGIYLEVHHSFKSGSMEAIEGQSEDDASFKIVDTPNYDVFGMSKPRKAMDCNCPNCDRLVAALRFAPHLESCMGMGRKKTSRTASRRLANAKEGNASYFSSNVSDDEDDADWSSEKRRKKIQSSRTNGSKKNGKSS